jgi:hypothetical protein
MSDSARMFEGGQREPADVASTPAFLNNPNSS